MKADFGEKRFKASAVLQWGLALAVILVAWWIWAAVKQNPLLCPSPAEVFAETFRLLGKAETYSAFLATFGRACAAFGVSFAAALACALFAGLFPGCKPVADRVVLFFRAVPTMSVIIVALLLCESDFVPVAVAVLVAFPVLYSAFVREAESEPGLEDVCTVYGVGRRKKARYLLLPLYRRAMLPQCEDTLPLCMKVCVAGEVLALPRFGLGKDLYTAKVSVEAARVAAITLLILAAGFLLQGFFRLLRRRQKYGSV